MLIVAAVFAGAALLSAVVLFGRSHGNAIKPPKLVMPPAGSRRAAPTFAETTLSGAKVSLGHYRGRPLVINFFASWCDPCKSEAPVLDRIYQRYRSGINFLSVAVNTHRRSSLNQFVSTYHMTWPVVWDRSGSMFDAFRLPGQPVTYIIDGRGRVVFEIVGNITRDSGGVGVVTEHEVTGVLDKLLA
jgi:thiol-disulfide isomerase/thioredoxin